MKKIFLLSLIFSIIFLTGCGKKIEQNSLDKIIERDTLIVGVKTDSKPFGFISKTGHNEGFDIDVARYVAKDLLGSERKVQFIPVTPNNRMEAITSGDVDMVIATMSITPQRQYFIDFSIPYYIAGQTAIVKKKSEIYNFSDLKHKKIIVVLGTTAEKNIRRIIPNATIIGFKNYSDAFNAFKQNQGEAISSDNTILSGFLQDNKDYRMLKNKISQEPYAIAIKKEDNQKLKKNLDIIVNRMINDGTIKNLKQKWHIAG